MSLVGPATESPYFVTQLSAAIPFYQQRPYAKPGLTGWAQVNLPDPVLVADARDKLAYDLYYLRHRSLLFDLLIQVSTIRLALQRACMR